MIVYGIGIFVISVGMILAGRGYVRTAQRMTGYATTRGRVIRREVVPTGGEGRNYTPKVTFVYTVTGVEHTADKLSYATHGYMKARAERELAAIPDDVEVHYDPENPDEAYLRTHTPRLGRWLIGGGIGGVAFGLLLLAAAA
jgi:Protein of unknown function (DUF3592)